METAIRESLDYPGELEKLYRSDKKRFEQSFFAIYPDIAGTAMADYWKARLEFDHQTDPGRKVLKSDLLFLIISCVLAGLLIKIPQLAGFDPDEYDYYMKNGGIIIFMGLSAYIFLTKNRINPRHWILSLLVFTLSALYINLLPAGEESDSFVLASIHLPLLFWCLYGLVFIDFDTKDHLKRIGYIRYNGDLAILTALILIVGGILTAVTIGLFSAIDLHIENFYMENIAIVGVVSAPIVATYIIRNFPVVTNRIAPIMAGIFSPLVLITLVVYLISIIVTGKDPYSDRDFLIMFNLMLLGVMAIIVFSVTGTSVHKKQRFNEWTLFVLSLITLIVNLIALSAIIYRLGEFGFTPNRTAV
ncbi:MAG: DUF4153 domain-containing protein, partial [Dehalobacter sp.]|nr:DUF4153 domain-containing protein [Dehalobacter sp.]